MFAQQLTFCINKVIFLDETLLQHIFLWQGHYKLNEIDNIGLIQLYFVIQGIGYHL